MFNSPKRLSQSRKRLEDNKKITIQTNDQLRSDVCISIFKHIFTKIRANCNQGELLSIISSLTADRIFPLDIRAQLKFAATYRLQAYSIRLAEYIRDTSFPLDDVKLVNSVIRGKFKQLSKLLQCALNNSTYTGSGYYPQFINSVSHRVLSRASDWTYANAVVTDDNIVLDSSDIILHAFSRAAIANELDLDDSSVCEYVMYLLENCRSESVLREATDYIANIARIKTDRLTVFISY